MVWVSSDQEAEQVRMIARSPEGRIAGRTPLATINEDIQPPAGTPSEASADMAGIEDFLQTHLKELCGSGTVGRWLTYGNVSKDQSILGTSRHMSQTSFAQQVSLSTPGSPSYPVLPTEQRYTSELESMSETVIVANLLDVMANLPLSSDWDQCQSNLVNTVSQSLGVKSSSDIDTSDVLHMQYPVEQSPQYHQMRKS